MSILNFFKVKLYVIIALSVVAITFLNIVGGYIYRPGSLQSQTIIIIPKHTSIAEITNILSEQRVITHPKLFELISYLYSYRYPLKSGEYELSMQITPYQILKKLADGKSIIHRFFIPEGSLVTEIIERLNQEERLVGKISDNVPEGYLMPSTYFFSYGDQRQKLVEKMRDEMSKTLDAIIPLLKEDSPLKTRLDVLILASIIEKEAGNDKERPKIAGVFINRLKKGMKLQADPTSAYAITEGKHKLNRPLTRKDLQITSPYNTYYIQGLPIGPISCPGRKSLIATVQPEKTDAFYFVIDGKGGHNFSKTLQEHNNNIITVKEKLAKCKDKTTSICN